MRHIPIQLRNWFKIHFLLDMLFAVPLFFAPITFLGFFGFETVEVNLARLVSAALFAIGGMSLWMNKDSYDSFVVMLRLKLIWSFVATLGLIWGAVEGGPKVLWFFAALFAAFFCLWQWWYYKIRGKF